MIQIIMLHFSDSESTKPKPKKHINYRLPETLSPYFYKLYLRPDIYTGDPETFTFTGTVVIHLTCLEATKDIVLNQVKE